MRPLIDPSPSLIFWRPPELPQIASKGIAEVFLNLETTGLKWFDGDRPVGMALDYPTDDGPRSLYHPWDERVASWMRDELRGVRITNINTRFDVHMAREAGVDWEAMNCAVSDVGHYAALLDDHRQRSNLDALALDYFGSIDVPRLDERFMASYDPAIIAPRSMYNVQLVRRLKEAMWPQLVAEDLLRVQSLEDSLIYVVCEMEKNGTPINVPLLHEWEARSRLQVDDLHHQIAVAAGWPIQVDLFGNESGHLNPDSAKDMERLFKQLGLPLTYTATGRPSFAGSVLDTVKHPVIELVKKLNRLLDLRAKYLVSDLQRIGNDGILRYALHQLRAVKDDSSDSGEAGTITGRFSSTEIVRGVGVNIQQRIKVAKQRVAWGYDEEDCSHDDEIYLIRQLHVPASGFWLSSDARQIEYRLFANEVNSPRINEMFAKDPLTSFHRLMHSYVKPRKPDITYRRMKDVNFAKIYVAGPKKIALMLGFITKAQFEELTETKAKNSHPLLRETMDILRIYDQEIPEANPLIQRASNLARDRGYICSLLGRRQRFPNKFRLHKALNSRIQPSAADIMKTKLVELHRERKTTQFLMRFTVHDEVNGDIPDEAHAKMVGEILDSQSFDLRIPILWETSTGANWKECA
jgi:DNA polymerase I-like protein with 3'-5' exonuclease and polymerase domains